MNSHLVWQTIQLCSMSWWIFSLPSSFVLLRKRCEQEKLLTASQHTFTITGKRDKSHKDREGAMRRRATLVVPVDRPDPEFWCSVQVSSCHDSVSFTSCLFLMHCCSCIWQYFFSLINLPSGFQFTLSSKWKKVPGLDALVLFCVEFALPPHLQGLGMQSSFRVLRLSYVNCWF